MDLFKDHSLNAWFVDGMLLRCKSVSRKAGSIAAATAIAAGVAFSAADVDFSVNPTASTLPSHVDVFERQATAQARVDALSKSIDAQLSTLGNRDLASVSALRMDKLRRAVASVASRKATTA